jgi:two-component sensor histidine kinase
MAKVKIVKNERDPPLFTGKLLIKFQNILRNTTQVIIQHRVKILFSVISSPITLEWQKSKIVKNEWDPPLFTGKLLIKFLNILRNTTQVIIRHRVKILFSVISGPITQERQK